MSYVYSHCKFLCLLKLYSLIPQSSEPEQERTVTHMLYTTWPDHGVPRNAMSLISFIRRVRKEHPTSLATPLLVHCSAGVGRTGTFILLDLAIQQMKREGTLSVFPHLQNMRDQRMKMIQSLVSTSIAVEPLQGLSFPLNSSLHAILPKKLRHLSDIVTLLCPFVQS